MRKQDEQTRTWQLYERGKEYNHRLDPDLYKTVELNERMYAGDQWAGVQAGDLPKSTFPIFRQILDYFVSFIMSKRVTIRYRADNIPTTPDSDEARNVQKMIASISKYTLVKWEKLKMDSLLREGLLDAAITGDTCAITLWDGSIKTGQVSGVDELGNPVPIMGDFYTELVDNTNVMFGNPNDTRVNANGKPVQPYILVYGRGLVSDLKAEAKKNKVKQDDIDKIVPDLDYDEQAGERGKVELNTGDGEEGGKCGYILHFWPDRETGTIHWSKSTKYVDIIKPVDMGISIYPIAWMNWTRRKNSYHGQAVGTVLARNQIIINKLHSMMSKWVFDMAFGKVIYDGSRIPSWTNAIGVAIKADGDVAGAVQQLQPGQISNAVADLFEMTIRYTREMMGANDVVLGNIKPENASTIISIQQQSQVPLENQTQALYQFVEDIALIWLEFILKKYDVPRLLPVMNKSEIEMEGFDAQALKDIIVSANVDVGPSTYWSEMASAQTLDNLLQQQQITFQQYLERIPDGFIADRQGLLNETMVQQQDKDLLYAMMAQFVQSLPPDVQQSLVEVQHNDPEAYESTIKQMMMEQMNVGAAGGQEAQAM